MSKTFQNSQVPNLLPSFKGFKNKIINGDFSVCQRGDAHVVENTAKYTIDRVRVTALNDNKVLIKQEEIYSPNEGSKVNVLDIFGDGSCVACYTFDNETANDLSGKYNGTWKDADGNTIAGTYDTGVFGGKAAKFNGSTQIDCGVINTDKDEVWVSFWMFWNGTDRVMPIGFNGYDLWLNMNYFGWNTDVGDLYGIDFPASVYANKWIHVVANFKTGAYGDKLFINGRLMNNLSQKLASIATDYAVIKNVNFHISGFGINSNYRFSGLIDQVRIFNRPLTEDEVRKLYVEDLTYIIKKHMRATLFRKGTTYTVTPYEYRFEGCDILPLVGKKVTLSFEIASSVNRNFTINIKYPDGTVYDSVEITYDGNGEFRRVSSVFDMSGLDTSKIHLHEGLGLILTIGENNEINEGDWIKIANVQLEEGTVATEFEHVPYDVQLLRCMRYYETSYGRDKAGTPAHRLIYEGAESALVTAIYGSNERSIVTGCTFKVPKSHMPTIKIYSYTGELNKVTDFDSASALGGTWVPADVSTYRFNICNIDTSVSIDRGKMIWFGWEAIAEL